MQTWWLLAVPSSPLRARRNTIVSPIATRRIARRCFRRATMLPIFVPWQGLPGWANRALWPLVMTPHPGGDRARAHAGAAQCRTRAGARRDGSAPRRASAARGRLGVRARARRGARSRSRSSPRCTRSAARRCRRSSSSFLDAGPAPVYFGFGSMPDARPAGDHAHPAGRHRDARLPRRDRRGLGGTRRRGAARGRTRDRQRVAPGTLRALRGGGAPRRRRHHHDGRPQRRAPAAWCRTWPTSSTGRGASRGSVWARPPISAGVGSDATRLVAALGAMLDNEVVAERARAVGERLRARPPRSTRSLRCCASMDS